MDGVAVNVRSASRHAFHHRDNASIPDGDGGIHGHYSSTVRDKRKTWEGRSEDHQTIVKSAAVLWRC